MKVKFDKELANKIINDKFKNIDEKVSTISKNLDKGYWKTKYGKVKITDMDDNHLIRTIISIEKNVEIRKNYKINELHNKSRRTKDIKESKLLENEIYNVIVMNDIEFIDTYFPVYIELIEEAEQRGII